MSKMSGCGKFVALVACSIAGRLLSAGVIYVAPELPEGSDGSGSSWANAMTSVADALLAASQMQGGGEAWVPDAFGAGRKLGKIAYGPINAAPHGLAILLR